MREGFYGQEWDCRCISTQCEGCKWRELRATINRTDSYTVEEKKPLYHMLEVCEKRWQDECKRTMKGDYVCIGTEEQLEFWHCTRCKEQVNQCKCSIKTGDSYDS